MRHLQRKVGDQAPAAHVVRTPAGPRFLFLEHLRSDDPRQARLQDPVNWPTARLAATAAAHPGLHPGSQFTITHLEHMTLPKAPKFVGPAIMGSATTPACRSRRR